MLRGGARSSVHCCRSWKWQSQENTLVRSSWQVDHLPWPAKIPKICKLKGFSYFTISSRNRACECFVFFPVLKRKLLLPPLFTKLILSYFFLLSVADRVIGRNAKFYTFCCKKQRTGNALHFSWHCLFISIYLLLSAAEKEVCTYSKFNNLCNRNWKTGNFIASILLLW